MVRQVTAPLEPLLHTDSTIQEDLLATLSVYLLDAQANVSRTAELLYLHKNTVKYRLHKINSCAICYNQQQAVYENQDGDFSSSR